MRIIGLSLNSRMLGLAVLESQSLLDHRVKLFKQQWSLYKARKMLAAFDSCLDTYKVVHIALVIPHDRYLNEETEIAIKHIKVHCSKRNIRCTPYSPSAFTTFCPSGKYVKKHMMTAVAQLYPELTFLQQKEQRNKSKYYYKLFEAAAAATLLAQDMTPEEVS